MLNDSSNIYAFDDRDHAGDNEQTLHEVCLHQTQYRLFGADMVSSSYSYYLFR